MPEGFTGRAEGYPVMLPLIKLLKSFEHHGGTAEQGGGNTTQRSSEWNQNAADTFYSLTCL